MKIRFTTAIVVIGLLASNAFSYGPAGHHMVGAIADHRLAKSNGTAAAKVNSLLDGLSLADAALLPDEIKDWDPAGPTPLPRLKSHPRIQQELADFWTANHKMVEGQALHRVYHFTDVPVLDQEKYADGTIGRPDHDIIHLIPFCIAVLQAPDNTENEHKITKSVAIILLAHYLGDIHQPLHVGAEYFDEKGKPTNPDKGGKFFIDEGGNNLSLSLLKSGKPVPSGKVLHGYWDGPAAATALGLMQDQFKSAHPGHAQKATEWELAQEFAGLEPAEWKLSPQLAVKDWAEAWANDILPEAREAHQRLRFRTVKIVAKHGRKEAVGTAEEIKTPDGISYRDWAGKVAVNEIHKGGWRLAALLAKIVK
jgi:S1/P1 nuclease